MGKVERLDYCWAALLAGKISRVGGGVRRHRSRDLEDSRRCTRDGVGDLTAFRIHTLGGAVEMDFAKSQDAGEVIGLDRATGGD